MNNEPKFCVNCRWQSFFIEHICGNPATMHNPVTGDLEVPSCFAMRKGGEPCGPDAKLWEENV